MVGSAVSPSVLHIGLFSGGAVLAAGIAWWAVSNREKQAAGEFAAFAGTISVWCLAVALTVALGSPAQYPLEVVTALSRYGMSLSWFLFAFRYTGYRERLTPGIRYSLIAATVLVLGLLLTDPVTGLYYADPTGITEPFVVTSWGETPVGAVGTLYGFLLVGIGTFALLYRFAATRYAGEWKVPFLLVTLGAAVFADYVAAFPVPGVYPGVDYAAVVTAVDAALYVLVLYRYDVFGFTPIARESIVTSLDDAIFVLDPDRRIVDFNEAAASTFDLDGAIGEPADSALPAAIADAENVRDGVPGNAEVSTVRAGRRVHYDVGVSPIENVEAQTGFVVTLRDVTELKESQQALARQNERLDDFAGTVAHDLRNPLSVARTFVADMDRDIDDDRPAEAIGALDRMDEMIDELLDLARQGETVRDPEPVSLAEYANRAWNVSDTGDATLHVEGSRTIRADPDRLQTLLENLFRNSVEHGSTDSRAEPGDSVEHGSTNSRDSKNPGDIAEENSASSQSPPDSGDSVEHGSTDSRAEPGDSVEHGSTDGTLAVYVEPTDEGFAVEDTGSGIPPDERDRVFEEGFTTRTDGTGFGLAIVRSIAGAHGWSIEAVEGDRSGGARFEVRI